MEENELVRKKGPVYLALFLLSAGLLLNYIIPPFQNPDEPIHFGVILSYSLGDKQSSYGEKEILRIMGKNQWWQYIGLSRSEVLSSKLSEIDFLIDYSSQSDYKYKVNNIVFYHFILGKICGILAKNNVLLSYYICRFFSYIFFLGALFFVYLTFKQVFGFRNNIFHFGIFFTLLLPQFFIISISVSPDTMSVFLCCVFFYAAAMMIFGNLQARYLILIILSTGMAFFIKKSIYSLIVMAVLIPLFLIEKKNFSKTVIYAVILLFIFALSAALVILFFPAQVKNSRIIAEEFFLKRIPQITHLFSFNSFSREFFLLLGDSFLLQFGWMAYRAQNIFYYIWRIVALFSIFGTTIYFGRSFCLLLKRKKLSTLFISRLKTAIFCLMAIGAQVLGFCAFYGSVDLLVQGRYLFPVIIPIAILFILGLKTFFDLFHKKGGKIAISTIITLMFFFLNYCIWNYMIPVFHLTIKSPHAGM